MKANSVIILKSLTIQYSEISSSTYFCPHKHLAPWSIAKNTNVEQKSELPYFFHG